MAAIALGVYPAMMFDLMEATTAQLVDTMGAGYQAAREYVTEATAMLR